MPMSADGVKRSLFDRLQDNYRLVILDDEDLKEVTSFNFSLLIFYILLSSVIILLSLLIIGFIAFTPAKQLIPGYGDIKSNQQFVKLSQKVEDLESKIQANDVYTMGLRNMLQSIKATSPDEKNTSTPLAQKISNKEIIEAMKQRELDHLIFATPISGPISAEYDPSIGHLGTDVLAPKGTPVKSIMEGFVINAESSVESGNTIMIQHPKNLISIYKHNSANLVKAGQKVQTGQAVAIVGNTGEKSTGPHLHVELWYDGQPVNPKNYITFDK
jgi:murein DD-endopeptidase MepM/ murein hydrolase activator NlpD